MVATLDDKKRSALGIQLADVKAVQQLIIENEQKLLSEGLDSEIAHRLRKFLEDDQKNLGIIETVIGQYGIQAEPKESTKELVEKARQSFQDSKLSLYEKVFKHELLKHQQVISGLTIHKAAQIVGADVLLAIAPLNTVNFENRAHQEQLKGILEILGVRELTGQDADQGIWGRVQDAVAALSGVVGSAVTQGTDKQDLNIQDVIRLDHNKVNTLFTELVASDDLHKIQEYFGQIYKDLLVHSIAEEEVVYPRARSFYGDLDTQELYDEQNEFKVLLDQIKAINLSSPQFKEHVKQLWEKVRDHVRQEESTLFAAIRNNLSTEQSEQWATDFKVAKTNAQKEFGVVSEANK